VEPRTTAARPKAVPCTTQTAFPRRSRLCPISLRRRRPAVPVAYERVSFRTSSGKARKRTQRSLPVHDRPQRPVPRASPALPGQALPQDGQTLPLSGSRAALAHRGQAVPKPGGCCPAGAGSAPLPEQSVAEKGESGRPQSSPVRGKLSLTDLFGGEVGQGGRQLDSHGPESQYAFSRIACRSVIQRILKSSPSDQFSM
jgi:hypothetical protein